MINKNDAEVRLKVTVDGDETKRDFGSITKSIFAATGAIKLLSTGFNALKNNMNAAINRYDALQKFPKVMKNFGVSSDEAAKSVDRIADSILGLPTSLDQAVSGVQSLFLVTKDLKKAETIFQAINDSAMVFAGGSTEAVDRFIYAYKQALSSGKVMAQDFNQMNEAIPGLMDKVAESMGVTFVDLKEGLSDGTISTEQFNNALKKLDTEGVGSMSALRDSAFEATGGIGTAITNMNSRIAAGLAEMIGAVEKGLQKAGLGNLSTIFSNIGSNIKNILISLAPYITKTIVFLSTELPKIVETVRNLVPYLEGIGIIIMGWKIGKTIQGIVQGFQTAKLSLALFSMQANGTTIAQAALNGTLKASEVITALLTGKLSLLELAQAGVSKAQAVLNTVMAANPIALIILAIAALIAIFVVLWKKCDWFRNFWIGLWNGIVSVFNTVIDFVKNNWQALLLLLVNPFAGAFKLLYNNCTGFRNFVNSFVNTIVNWFKSIPGKLKSMATGIVNVFKSIPSQMLSIGKNIVQGLWNGISGLKNWVISKVKNLGKSILNSIKSVLGIHSPSTEFALVGKFSVLGLEKGFEDNEKELNKTIEDTIGLDFLKNGSVNVSNMYGNLTPNISNNQPIYVNVEADMDVDKFGRAFVNDIKVFSGGTKNSFNYGGGK